MRINIGTDDENRKIEWDTHTSPLLSIYGPVASGKTRMLNGIMRQAARKMAVIRFGVKNEVLPVPTIMNVECLHRGEALDNLRNIQAEQKRRARNVDGDVRPILIAVDDFNAWLDGEPDSDTFRTLASVMQNCRGTSMCMAISVQSYPAACRALRKLIGQTNLCDAGSHAVLVSDANIDVLRRQNTEESARLLVSNGGVFETNTGTLMPLRRSS